jgi:hypothetical protein
MVLNVAWSGSSTVGTGICVHYPQIQGFTAPSEPSIKKPFARGVDYVAVSRPTELSKLFLLGLLTDTKFTDVL